MKLGSLVQVCYVGTLVPNRIYIYIYIYIYMLKRTSLDKIFIPNYGEGIGNEKGRGLEKNSIDSSQVGMIIQYAKDY